MKGGTGEQRLGADLQCRGGAPSAAKSMQQSNGSSAKSSCDAECGGAGAAAGGGGAAAPADGTSAPQMRHYWEESVFEGHPMSDTCRQGLRYGQLVPLCRASSKQPLLLSSVKGNDSEGRPFRWVARRQRKRVSHPHQCPTPPPALRWLGWLDVRLHSAKPGWWVGLLFTLGSVCFVLSGAAALWRSVGDAAEPAGLASLAAALVSWPNAVAANLCFFPAGLLQLFEAVNMDYDGRLRAWAKAGGRGSGLPRPRRRLAPSAQDLRTISLWAVLIQVMGMLGFNMATVCTLVGHAVALDEHVRRWTVKFGFTFGGAAFTVSSVLFCCEATGSWWRGLVPSRLSDLRSISWHSVFWGLQGSIGFLIAGAALYAADFSWTQMQWIEGYGALGGAVWFLLSALAMLVEQSSPQHP